MHHAPLPKTLEAYGYDWPIKASWSPMPHQKMTANFLALNPRSFCFNDMGTMKTLSTLWAADFVMEMARRRGVACRAIVVAPLSILDAVWGRTIWTHFLGRRTYRILHGSHEKRRRELAQHADFYIINHDGLNVGIPKDSHRPLHGLAADLEKREDIKIAIVDEASAYRDSTTMRSRNARKLLGGRPYLWLLTGTPTPNGPIDAYGLAKLVNNAKGENFTHYKQRVMMQVAPWKWVTRVGGEEAASALMQPAIRFNSEFLKLPPQEAELRHIPFSPEQAKAYKSLEEEAILLLQQENVEHKILAVNEAALRLKLIQVACGEIYDANHKTHHLCPTPRLGEVEDIIRESPHKVVIFCGLTNSLNMLRENLSQKWECELVNGQTGLRDRDAIFRRFGDTADKLRILLADPVSVSHGVNDLVSASSAIWYAPTDRNEVYRQGNKRLDRPGQSGATKVFQLYSTDVEREIYARLDRNESMQGVILKLAEGRR